MKLSVSLPAEDIETLDAFVRSARLPSRSAALQHAVRMLRHPHLEQDYEAAWDEWDASEDSGAWAAVDSDGLGDASR